jgi:hypothetical protein
MEVVMLNVTDDKYTYQLDKDGNRVNSLVITSDNKKAGLTVTEFRDFLNDLIKEGYGDYSLEASTQDGSSYSVRCEVLAHRVSKTIEIN